MRIALSYLCLAAALLQGQDGAVSDGLKSRTKLAEVVESKGAEPIPVGIGDASTYMVGPGDLVEIWVRDSPEISDRSFRVSSRGTLRLPILGELKIAGLTVQEVEAEILQRLGPYFYDPELTVTIVELRSQPISVVGSVERPGIQQLVGRTTLVEALSAAGGLTSDASNIATITREISYGELPFVTKRRDSTGRYDIADVSLGGITEGSNPAANIVLQPHDVISVSRADIVYVIGEVNRAGGFVLDRNKEVSVLQAVAMAEGLRGSAAPANAKILRPVPGEARKEIAVNVKKIINGKAEDLRMLPDDILIVPSSTAKKVMQVAVGTAVGVGSGILLWRVGRP
jgi:polysaccharide export outer membrane protein